MAESFDVLKDQRKELYVSKVLVTPAYDTDTQKLDPAYYAEFKQRGDVKGQEADAGKNATTGLAIGDDGSKHTESLQQIDRKTLDEIYKVNNQANPLKDKALMKRALESAQQQNTAIQVAQETNNLAVNAPVVENDPDDGYVTAEDAQGQPATTVLDTQIQKPAPGKDGQAFNYAKDEVPAEQAARDKEAESLLATPQQYPIADSEKDESAYQKQVARDARANNGDNYRQLYVKSIEVSSTKLDPVNGGFKLATDEKGNVEPQYTATFAQRGDTEDVNTPDGALNQHAAGNQVGGMTTLTKDEVDALYNMNGQENPMNDKATYEAFNQAAKAKDQVTPGVGYHEKIAQADDNLATLAPVEAKGNDLQVKTSQMQEPRWADVNGGEATRFNYERDEKSIEHNNEVQRDYMATHNVKPQQASAQYVDPVTARAQHERGLDLDR